MVASHPDPSSGVGSPPGVEPRVEKKTACHLRASAESRFMILERASDTGYQGNSDILSNSRVHTGAYVQREFARHERIAADLSLQARGRLCAQDAWRQCNDRDHPTGGSLTIQIRRTH